MRPFITLTLFDLTVKTSRILTVQKTTQVLTVEEDTDNGPGEPNSEAGSGSESVLPLEELPRTRGSRKRQRIERRTKVP